MNAYKDRIAETERVKERNGARVERGAGDVPGVPENRDDEQVSVRQADASGGDIRENPARRGQNARHPRWQKRIRQQVKNGQVEEDSTIGARSSECSSVFRPNCCSGKSCEW